MQTGQAIEMGNIPIVSPDGDTETHSFALVVRFPDAESLRQALADRECRFEMFGS